MCKNCVATIKKFSESSKTNDSIDTNTSTTDSSSNESQNTSSKLSTTVISIPSDTSNYIKGLSWGGTKWNWNYGDSNKLKYYFGTDATSSNCPAGVTYLNGSAISTSAWTTAEKSAMRVGLLKWLKIIGMYETISDIESAEVYNEADSNLKFYLTTENTGYYGAQFGPHSNYPGVGIYVRYSGNTWTESLDPGGFGFITIIHELGHAMGLAHPHDAGGGSGNFPGVTWNGDQGDNNLNQNMYTVMSYIDTNSGINPTSQTPYGFCTGPMGFDIATMKFLYGLNPSYNNTASTYTIGDTNVNDTGYTTIYDTGSEDLIIYSGSKAVTIDLRPATITNSVGGGGYVSKVDDSSVFTGFTIAEDVQIEKATGGSGDDHIYQVETVENIITGNGGIDTVHYSDTYADYTVTDVSSGNDGSHVTVTKNGITDNLYSIEKLNFSDGIVETNNIKEPSTPSTDYVSYSSTPNLTINSSNLVLTDDIVITSNNQNVTNIDLVLDSILHTWVGDLKITLTNVTTGTSVILVNLAGSGTWGSNGNNFTNTVLSDSASTSINSIVSGDSPHTGNYYPSNNTTRTYLSSFNGENINSTWRLTVEDTYASLDDGSWVKWSLRFTPKEPEKTVTSTAITSVSNLFNSDNLDSLVEGSSIYIGTNPSSTTTDDAIFNNSFGKESLKNLTTGSRNFSLGYGSLFNLINGANNISIGIDSQSSNISGYGNLSFGNRSLNLNETTNVNIAIGENALSSLTNGNNNISIGYNSTKDAQNISNTINIGNNVNGNGSNTATIGNTGITKVYMNDNGDGEIYANGTINTSDKNLKKNIVPTELGLDFINQLNPVSYEWKNKQNNKKSQGLIAQEVEETMNNLNMSKNEYSLVNYDESNNKYGINYSELIGPLIKAVQELSNENKELKKKISSLL
tara:strand:- start:754 stop:3489 length:2736 start_codon:yes stop_codon:yes gene_type:complete